MSQINIALTVALLNGPPKCLSYAPLTGDACGLWPIGLRVRVPLGRRELVGIIVGHEPPPGSARLRPVIAALDAVPLLTSAQIAWFVWISRYYRAALGETLAAALPPPLRVGTALPEVTSLGANPCVAPEPATLHPEQTAAVAAVITSLGQFGCFLLDGVTGSGKTEVYLALIQAVLARGEQVLVLVPEIALTPQLAQRFQRRLGAAPAVLHSRLTTGERLRTWARLRAGVAKLLLGTRSAVLTPLPHLGLIVVDEEHDPAYKQEESPRYHARDLAVLRAQWAGVPVLLGTATPSLESLRNVALGRYQRLVLAQRAQTRQPLRWEVIDARRQPLRAGLTPPLLAALRTTLAAGTQAILLLNQRGFAPVLLCHACGWQARCDHCDARLVLHQAADRLRCHHCGAEQPRPPVCPACQSAELIPVGQGTERLEQVLRQQLPTARIGRLDRDSTRRKGSLEQTLAAMSAGELDVLLGTQMLAKGHDFPQVTLVGVLAADAGLCSVDLRASERLLQLLVQVGGRAGRGALPGRVLLQTHQPGHPLLLRLLDQGYHAAAALLLAERQAADWPPFSALALLRVDAKTPETAQAYAVQAATLAQQHAPPAGSVLGPVAAPMARRQGRHRVQLLLQAPERRDLQAWLEVWLAALTVMPGSRQVRWSLDVDPMSLL